jgi:hypothetical protein
LLYVNLIEERLKGRALKGTVARLGTLGLIVVALGLGILIMVRVFQVRDLQHRMVDVGNQIKKMEPDAEKCKEKLVDIAQITPLWKLADQVTISQQTWGMVLVALSECRPPNGFVTLETMDSHAGEKDKPAVLIMRGFASSEFAISNYQMALNGYKADPNAPGLFDPNATKLSEVTATTREGRDVKTFGIELGLGPQQGGAANVPK